jgi:hypothetical protein
MKLNLLLTILVVLALVVVAAVPLRAVIATQAVIYHGEAAQSAGDPCAAEKAGPNQVQPAVELGAENPTYGIDRCKQDLNLRAPHRVEYAYMIRPVQQIKGRRGGCDGLMMPDYID